MHMNHKLAIAKTLFPMEGWEDRLFRSKFRLAHRIARSPEGWLAKSVSWNSLTNWELNFACKPYTKRGRPSTRWDDILTNFFFRVSTMIIIGGMLQARLLRSSSERDLGAVLPNPLWFVEFCHPVSFAGL